MPAEEPKALTQGDGRADGSLHERPGLTGLAEPPGAVWPEQQVWKMESPCVPEAADWVLSAPVVPPAGESW